MVRAAERLPFRLLEYAPGFEVASSGPKVGACGGALVRGRAQGRPGDANSGLLGGSIGTKMGGSVKQKRAI